MNIFATDINCTHRYFNKWYQIFVFYHFEVWMIGPKFFRGPGFQSGFLVQFVIQKWCPIHNGDLTLWDWDQCDLFWWLLSKESDSQLQISINVYGFFSMFQAETFEMSLNRLREKWKNALDKNKFYASQLCNEIVTIDQ